MTNLNQTKPRMDYPYFEVIGFTFRPIGGQERKF